VAAFNLKKSTAPDVGSLLADFHADQLATLGYHHRQQLNRTMKNTRQAPLYRLMLFSRHPLAAKLFGAISASTPAQRGFKF
jgi:hypothetical protein